MLARDLFRQLAYSLTYQLPDRVTVAGKDFEIFVNVNRTVMSFVYDGQSDVAAIVHEEGLSHLDYFDEWSLNTEVII